jgi:alpha-2-macroglobulin-like protein
VSLLARVDGMEIQGAPAEVDPSGNCTVTFVLPKEIPRGDGTLGLTIQDGGMIETASKTIPILLQTVDLKLYPEGGDLVTGLPARVYFEARTPVGKPADIAGVVVDAKGKEVAQFRSEHEGRGRFDIAPAVTGQYILKIMEPSGIKTTYPLPEPKARGAIVRARKDVYGAEEKVTLLVGGSNVKNLKVTLSCREVELAATEISVNDVDYFPGREVILTPPAGTQGVLVATVWDEMGMPLAERLVFRKPAQKLNVRVTADRKSFIPGDKVKLTVHTADANDEPVSGVVGLAVTDDAILEMIEKREQAPRLPVMVFLEPEVRELADAHVYLDDQNPKAPLAVDLLLGTQGWRRFAFVNSAQFITDYSDAAARVVALRVPPVPATRFKGGRLRGEDGVVMLGAVPEDVDWFARRAGAAKGVVERRQGEADARKVAKPQRPAPARPAASAPAVKPDAIFDFGDRKRLAKEAFAEEELLVGNVVAVREYAHEVRPDRKPGDRVDFAETLYWHAGLKTDAKTGEASVCFALSDSVTTFRVFSDAFGGDGAVASAISAVESVQPFYIEPKIPLEVSSGDVILLPVGVVSAVSEDLRDSIVTAELKGDFQVSSPKPFDLASLERARQMFRIAVGDNNGTVDVILNAIAGPYADNVTRKLSVRPRGFPIEMAHGGILGPQQAASHTVTIPQGVVPRSVTTNISVYPTPLANMTEALERLIQDPNGCFEQTSSTSYPLTMAQQYFLTHTGVDARLVERSRTKLDAGYKRLVGFWCPDRGYEWFGQDPGHEALTAFGLLHFADMAKVREVDQNMVTQTRAWLMKQRDGKGGFERKRRALHTWIEDKDCSNAYIVWAALEGAEPAASLDKEIAALKAAAAASQNSYVVALAANVMSLCGDAAEARKLMDRLVAKQAANGSVSGGTATIVGSGGDALVIETTSLAALAWLRDPAYAGSVEKSMKFLADSCKAGRFGSTQSTVLALRAIVAYDKARAKPKAAGKVTVLVDGKPVGDGVAFQPTTEGAIKLPDISSLLTPGEHEIDLKMEGGGDMPYSATVNYNALTPASSKECKLDLAVRLAQGMLTEGNITEANVTITNKSKEVVPTPVAIIGLPGGLEPRHDQLKELVKKGTIDAYEVIGRDVVLYWRTLDKEAKVDVPLSLVAALPGQYTGPASRTYLYYTDEHKQWVDGLRVSIAAK